VIYVINGGGLPALPSAFSTYNSLDLHELQLEIVEVKYPEVSSLESRSSTKK